MTANAPIDKFDIHNESVEIANEIFGCQEQPCTEPVLHLEEWARSIAERVERQTIERVMAQRMKDLLASGGSAFIPRLYGPKSDKEEGKL